MFRAARRVFCVKEPLRFIILSTHSFPLSIPCIFPPTESASSPHHPARQSQPQPQPQQEEATVTIQNKANKKNEQFHSFFSRGTLRWNHIHVPRGLCCPSRLLLAPVNLRDSNAVHSAIRSMRNIGIVAHIDAGKTTTTERMLFYAGVLKRIGDVDSGTTTTDFMKEEADRGITIQSAAVSLEWRGHGLHLIDTPGHVDFTVEVERAMRVVDGVVALFDASAGVQAQSYTVLQQSKRYHVPVLAFLNKMDKLNANFDSSVRSLREKLGVEPVLLQRPYHGEDGSFLGVIDVVEQQLCEFHGAHGSEVRLVPLTGSAGAVEDGFGHVRATLQRARHELLTELSGRDDALSEAFIHALDATDGDEVAAEAQVPVPVLRAAIRRCLLTPPAGHTPIMPVLCGASRRDQGVQPLLDAVTYYLPSPKDRHPTGLSKDGIPVDLPPASAEATVPTVALAFKVTHAMHPSKGKRLPLVFFRVYSGRVLPRMSLSNHSRGKSEVIDKLYVMHANTPVEVPHLIAGEIGAAFLTHTYTGDTLFAHPSQHLLQAKQHLKKGEVVEEVYTLEGITAPPAVISFSIEAATRHQIELLKSALEELAREDPSLRVSQNEQGTIVVSGMGELHLEIVMSRLTNEYQVRCRLLRAIIEYRETILAPQRLERFVCVLNELPFAECSLDLVPLLDENGGCDAVRDVCRFRISKEFEDVYLASQSGAQNNHHQQNHPNSNRVADVRNAKEDLRLLQACFSTALQTCSRLGPLAGLPLHGVEIVLTHFRKIGSVSPLIEKQLQQAARSAVLALLQSTPKEELSLMEPMMNLEVHLSEPTYIGQVVSSLNEHKAVLVDVLEDGRSVRACVAMRNTLKYTMTLRKAVKGHANMFMKLSHYQLLEDKAVVARVLKNLGITE